MLSTFKYYCRHNSNTDYVLEQLVLRVVAEQSNVNCGSVGHRATKSKYHLIRLILVYSENRAGRIFSEIVYGQLQSLPILSRHVPCKLVFIQRAQFW